ncbi:hypothetical protein BS78_08G050000 [Paspalum vaginatum]|nr:hypothetical protein BS78_08G050000 [Paspalum vaginatum]
MVETRSRIRKRELSASEGGVILKRKKEVMEKKKVVRRRLVPQKFIDFLKKEGLYTIFPTDYSEEELAKSSQEFRDFYKAKKEIQDAERAYELAILEEHEIKGYAIDGSEFDDDDDHDEDTVKN